jgi:hypothetical protein
VLRVGNKGRRLSRWVEFLALLGGQGAAAKSSGPFVSFLARVSDSLSAARVPFSNGDD